MGQREASVETTSFHSLVNYGQTCPTKKLHKFFPQIIDDDKSIEIQSRPLPTPPTPRVQRAAEPGDGDDDEFHSLRSNTLKSDGGRSHRTSMTLGDSHKEDLGVDETLAESIIDSMHTCLDTMPTDEGVKATSGENTLNEEGMQSDEDEFMAEMLPHDNAGNRASTPNA